MRHVGQRTLKPLYHYMAHISSTSLQHTFILQGGPYHDPLHNILGAYACYRPDVGYVQGMSFLAATLLLNMDEVKAFISFSNLLNRPAHMAFFRVNQPMVGYSS